MINSGRRQSGYIKNFKLDQTYCTSCPYHKNRFRPVHRPSDSFLYKTKSVKIYGRLSYTISREKVLILVAVYYMRFYNLILYRLDFRTLLFWFQSWEAEPHHNLYPRKTIIDKRLPFISRPCNIRTVVLLEDPSSPEPYVISSETASSGFAIWNIKLVRYKNENCLSILADHNDPAQLTVQGNNHLLDNILWVQRGGIMPVKAVSLQHYWVLK